MVEYWFWSATQTRIGSGDLKNGAQNTSIGAGRERRQAKTPATISTTSSPMYKLRERLETDGWASETFCATGISSICPAGTTSSGGQNCGAYDPDGSKSRISCSCPGS